MLISEKEEDSKSDEMQLPELEDHLFNIKEFNIDNFREINE